MKETRSHQGQSILVPPVPRCPVSFSLPPVRYKQLRRGTTFVEPSKTVSVETSLNVAVTMPVTMPVGVRDMVTTATIGHDNFMSVTGVSNDGALEAIKDPLCTTAKELVAKELVAKELVAKELVTKALPDSEVVVGVVRRPSIPPPMSPTAVQKKHERYLSEIVAINGFGIP